MRSFFLQVYLYLSILILYVTFSSNLMAQKKIVGYYYPPAVNSSLTVENFQFSNLTHIIHSFILLSNTGDIVVPAGILYPELISAAHKSGKKVLIAIGGWDQSDNFSAVAADSLLRQKFAKNLTEFIKVNGYDGVDIDWEFPADMKQGQDLTKLIQEIRSSFSTVNPELLITLAVTPSDWIGKYFEYSRLISYVDWFNLMSYNFHGSWTTHSGHNAPLYSPATDPDGSVDSGVKYLSSTRGVPKSKIMVGVPFYGRQFNSSGLYKPQSGDVTDIIYTDEDKLLNSGLWEYYWDDISKVPYMLNKEHTKFITFDDTASIRIKGEYIVKNDLAGAMIWALGEDVVSLRQPLLESIAKAINSTQTSVNTGSVSSRSDYRLFDNYPNPFNSSTVISFNLKKAGKVKLFIYNSLGQKIRVLLDIDMPEGLHEVKYDASSLPSGIYFCQLLSGDFSAVNKMILEK